MGGDQVNQSEAIDQLSAALVAAQGHFEAVDKSAENPFFKSHYADLPAIVKAIQPILLEHGLAVTQWPGFDGDHDLLTTRVFHTSGQWIESSMRLYLAKQDPQGQGSAITYARRYALSAALGIVTEEDDDGQAASKTKRTSSRQSAAPRQAARPPINGTCSACGGTRTKTLASGKEIPCPACGKEPETTKPLADDESIGNGEGGQYSPPDPESLDSARREAGKRHVQEARAAL